MTARIKSALYNIHALLLPPIESKRTWTVLDREFCRTNTYPALSPLKGLATTICVASFSFFNSFYYTGRAIRARIIKARHPNLAEKLPVSLRPALSSFLLFSASLLYLIYSIATLSIGPYFTNRRVINSLYFSADLGLPSISEPPDIEHKPLTDSSKPIEWDWTEEDKLDSIQNSPDSGIYTGF